MICGHNIAHGVMMVIVFACFLQCVVKVFVIFWNLLALRVSGATFCRKMLAVSDKEVVVLCPNGVPSHFQGFAKGICIRFIGDQLDVSTL